MTKESYVSQSRSLARSAVERIPEVEPRRLHVLSADIEADGHTRGCLGCAALASHGRAAIPHNECRERIRTIDESTLTGKARMTAYKDRVAETQRVTESKKSSSRRRCRRGVHETWARGADGGSAWCRIWRGRERDNTTRTE